MKLTSVYYWNGIIDANGAELTNEEKTKTKTKPEAAQQRQELGTPLGKIRAFLQPEHKGPVREWVELIVSVVVIVFLIRLVLVEAFRIPTGSMEDTLLVGDFLLVNKFVYGIRSPDWVGVPFTRAGFFVPFFHLPSFKEPEPGDIVVFRYPLDKKLSYIKRCIAVGGQTVEISEKQVFVDGELVEMPNHGKHASDIVYPRGYVEPAIVPRNLENRNRDNFGPITVPEGKLFVMGDNRDNSADSRYWGFLDRELVIGQALIIYFSWDHRKALHQLNRKIRWERIGNLIR
ncbi:signal peptidase I [Calditrichota bacterium]